MEPSASGKRVCLLLGTDTVPRWFASAVEHMAEEARATVTSVVVVYPPSSLRPTDLRSASRNPIVRLAARLDVEPDPEPVHITSLDSVAGGALTMHQLDPDAIEGGRVRLPDSLVATIGERADLVVHYGVGILAGPILTEPIDGVLSYHEGDVRAYRGSSSGFWERIAGEATMTVTLQQLTETLDGGRVVCTRAIDLHDADTIGSVRRRCEETAEPMLAEAVEQLGRPDFTPETVPSEELGTLYRRSDRNAIRPSLLFVCTELFARIRARLQ